jgi:hypothetical protein
VAGSEFWQTDVEYIKWKDNLGNCGFKTKIPFMHKAIILCGLQMLLTVFREPGWPIIFTIRVETDPIGRKII